MISAGHWKIVGTDFSSLSPLSPLAPQLIQFCFSMGSTEWCQLLSAMFFSVPPQPSTVLSCTTFCSTKMPLVLPEWYHCSAETQQGPAVCRAWHPFNDSGTGSEANDFGIIQNHLHKKKNNCYYCIYSIHICEGMSPSWLLIQNTKIPAGWSMWRSKHPQKSPWWALLPGCLGRSSCLGISALLPGHGTDLASSPCTPC